MKMEDIGVIVMNVITEDNAIQVFLMGNILQMDNVIMRLVQLIGVAVWVGNVEVYGMLIVALVLQDRLAIQHISANLQMNALILMILNVEVILMVHGLVMIQIRVKEQ
jgi:hypothetical protein